MFQPFTHMNHYVIGLANYRAGHYSQAVDHLQRSLKIDPRWRSRAISYPVLAMAYQRNAQKDNCAEDLETG